MRWRSISALLGAVVLIASALVAWDQIMARTPWATKDDFVKLVQVVTPQRLQAAEMRVVQINRIIDLLLRQGQQVDQALVNERLWLCQQIAIMRRLLGLPPSLVCRSS